MRMELGKKGYEFKTNSDTEVILYSYIEWGNEFVNKCNGMWVLAIWDDVKKEIFLSRDRFELNHYTLCLKMEYFILLRK